MFSIQISHQRRLLNQILVYLRKDLYAACYTYEYNELNWCSFKKSNKLDGLQAFLMRILRIIPIESKFAFKRRSMLEFQRLPNVLQYRMSI